MDMCTFEQALEYEKENDENIIKHHTALMNGHPDECLVLPKWELEEREKFEKIRKSRMKH